MRIALIAMSGIRVQNAELMAAGLTMPGIIERSKVIASLPSLSLLTLAALTPADVEIEYHEIADLRAQGLPKRNFDLVAISTMTAQSRDAYEVARRYRTMGIPVVMGGLHATAVPDEVASHCDSVIVGEGEPLWPQVVEDAREGTLQSRYRAQEEFDLANAPMPRFDLLDIKKYNRLTVQTTRGCPHACEFCASSIMLTSKYKVKPVDKVIAEIRAIKRLWPQPFIELADDNSFAMRGHAKDLLRAMATERVSWFTEADISIAKDPELLALMRRAGCRQVLIGLESPVDAGLDAVETRSNFKLRQFPKYEDAVRTIQAHGITVNGCFILGLDGHTTDIFDSVYDFAMRTGLYDVQVTVQTPFPGTPLYARLARENRLTHPGQWDRCTLFDVNYKPSHMTPRQLELGLLNLVQRLYDPQAVRARREGYFNNLHRAAG